jgi:hypothetical protein
MAAFVFASPALIALVAALSTPPAVPSAPHGAASAAPRVAATASPAAVVPASAAASAAPAVQASAAPVVTLRRLEYALSEKADGDPVTSTLEMDVTGVNAGRGLTFRLVDRQDAAASAPVDARLDLQDGMSVTGDGGFSDREEVLLALFELSFENLDVREKGAKWIRVEHTPDGTATASYEVQSAVGSLVNLSVKYEVGDGNWTSSWQGKVVYNAIARAPLRADFSGQSSIAIRLAADSLAFHAR